VRPRVVFRKVLEAGLIVGVVLAASRGVRGVVERSHSGPGRPRMGSRGFSTCGWMAGIAFFLLITMRCRVRARMGFSTAGPANSVHNAGPARAPGEITFPTSGSAIRKMKENAAISSTAYAISLKTHYVMLQPLQL